MLFLCADTLWTLWKTRNELVFDDKVIPTTDILIFKLTACLSHWKKLLPEKNLQKVEEMLGEIRQKCAAEELLLS